MDDNGRANNNPDKKEHCPAYSLNFLLNLNIIARQNVFVLIWKIVSNE